MEWADTEIYIVMDKAVLCIFSNGELHQLILQEGDILGEDWAEKA